MEFIIVFIAAVFVDNVVPPQLLGIYPFLGVSKKVSTATGMGAAVTFVLLLTTMVTRLIQTYILVPIELKFLQTIAFVLVIVTSVQVVEMIIKKISSALYQTLDVFLPLIMINCYALGVAVLVIQKEFIYVEPPVYAASIGIGFLLAMIIFASIREQLAKTGSTPHVMKGTPIVLITAGILAMAFTGFSGLAAI